MVRIYNDRDSAIKAALLLLGILLTGVLVIFLV